ncbi:molybdenum ABC transporter ATP-binding protein [Marinobacter zhejiangensis]|uniref:Molybdate transport system ATP-binding protein n=1 Tax=Marinobacter zhejiangensis TaxID=488535 RepID=A0A1I4L325_9GAMM|nr:molybdenum ABC transporter ATP-binding protein [Marinobacter zhejiangensis]SFL85374.1 molybdate transport system ATP-binding protein [Marinobacter zhejiangensis]
MTQAIRISLNAQRDQFTLEADLTLPARGITVIFGPSGCGKTTLLRCVAGLQPATGELDVNGDCWQSDHQVLAVHERPLAYVFQEASLFPHLSVQKNLLYGFVRIAPEHRQIQPDQAIQWLGLEHLLNRKPDQLSGGERQRVAIARALLTSPRLLLMDEPLSALDQASKRDILPYLQRLHDELAIPVIYVTHSLDELARLADYLVLMDAGRVLAQGPLQEVMPRLDLPLSRDEDASVIVTAVIREHDTRWHLSRSEFDSGSLWVRTPPATPPGSTIRLRILARDVSIALAHHPDQSIQNLLPATISELSGNDHSGMAMVRLQLNETPLLARLTNRAVDLLGLEVGQSVWVQIKAVAIVE